MKITSDLVLYCTGGEAGAGWTGHRGGTRAGRRGSQDTATGITGETSWYFGATKNGKRRSTWAQSIDTFVSIIQRNENEAVERWAKWNVGIISIVLFKKILQLYVHV